MKKKINENYWNKFYKKFTINIPSSFAKFVVKRINLSDKILDVGCGNGRDTFFFLKHGFKTTGIDKSQIVIKKNNAKLKNFFYKIDICSKKLNLSFLKKKKISKIYARFFIHAINKQQQLFFFANIRKILSKNTQIFLEFRTSKDPMKKYGKKISENERISDHYRRFINSDEFQSEVLDLGFKVMFRKESFNFAKFGKQKPHICRMILSV